MSQPARAAGLASSFSVLAADVTVKGNIAAEVDLHLDGRVEGDVACATLVQGPGSVIKGAVIAQTARLSGTVEGSIAVKELVVLASARISGDVSYETLTIEQGGQVDGRLSHGTHTTAIGHFGDGPKVELIASN
ncbi:polymer-forming cytoskeletal protein [Sandaracinobacter sp. RS1-74]|nr:polymer-forming cytoskeletal protein [Sandaracinobacteroides sayramensis]